MIQKYKTLPHQKCVRFELLLPLLIILALVERWLLRQAGVLGHRWGLPEKHPHGRGLDFKEWIRQKETG